MYREKFDTLVAALKDRSDAEDFLDDIHSCITSCGAYIEAVNSMESVITVMRFRLEPDEYREKLSEVDKRRRSMHNGLIANVTILDRICRMAEQPPIYGGDYEDRLAIAEFAMDVTAEMYETRKL